MTAETTIEKSVVAEIFPEKMKAGDTDIDVGTKVKIMCMSGEDSYLNGLTGKATHPFPIYYSRSGLIGIWLDNGGTCNAKISEVKIIDENKDILK